MTRKKKKRIRTAKQRIRTGKEIKRLVGKIERQTLGINITDMTYGEGKKPNLWKNGTAYFKEPSGIS